MEMTATNAYVHVILGLLVNMLVMFAIALVMTMTPAHAPRMSAVPDHIVHVSEMMHVTDDGERSCADQLYCGAAEDGSCDFVCAGFTTFLPVPSPEAGQEYVPSRHAFQSEANDVGRAPGLNERPPELRFL